MVKLRCVKAKALGFDTGKPIASVRVKMYQCGYGFSMCLNVILLFFDSVDSNAYNDGLETFPTTVPPLAQADENANM